MDGAPRVDLAVLAFGYKNHVGIDRRHRLIRRWTAGHRCSLLRRDAAARADRSEQHRHSDVCADTAYRSGQREVPRRAPPAFTGPSQETQEMLWGERRGRGTLVAANKTDGGALLLR